MTKFLIGSAALALVAATPAFAQLGGALGGGLSGGLGGSLGGISGSAGGMIGGSLDRTRSVTDAAQRSRGDIRRAERAARRVERRQGTVDGSLTGAARLGRTDTAASAATSGQLALDSSRTRGVIAVSQRGLRRVAATASGVPVFVSARTIPAPLVVSRPVIASYPVFDRSVYYGGTDVVFVPSGDVHGYMDRHYDDLRHDLAGTGATVSRRGDDLVVALPADVTFAFDRADIQPRFVGTLAAVARSLDTYRATDVEIIGHTDAIGTEDYNLALSERRGRSVADFLVARSADPSRLVVEAMGESEPVASNATISGRAANRRVEIVFHPRAA